MSRNSKPKRSKPAKRSNVTTPDDPDNIIRSLKPKLEEKSSRKVSDADVVNANPLRLYRTLRLAKLWDVDPATIWRWRQQGILPPPVHVGGITGWTEGQLKAVMAEG